MRVQVLLVRDTGELVTDLKALSPDERRDVAAWRDGLRRRRIDAGKPHGPRTWHPYAHVCPECEQPFYTARPDAITCSPKCRKRRHRVTRKSTICDQGDQA